MLHSPVNFLRFSLAQRWLLWVLLLVWGRLGVWADPSVTLTWCASTDPNAVGYRVYYGGASGVYTNAVEVGNATNVTVSGLVAGDTYYFTAATVTASGAESAFCNEATYVIPAADTNLSATATNSTTTNSLPTLGAITNLTVNENAGWQTVALTGISAGSTSGGALVVSATSSNPEIIGAPIVSYTSPNSTGTLTFAPVTNAAGACAITVTIINKSVSNAVYSLYFNVIVTKAIAAGSSPNNALTNGLPTLGSIANVSLAQGATSETVSLTGIGLGATGSKSAARITTTSSNSRLASVSVIHYASPGTNGALTLRLTPAMTGTATITVTLNNGGKSNNIVRQSFTVTVVPPVPPTLAAISNVTVRANSGEQKILLTGISSGATNGSGSLTVSASCNNKAIQPKVEYSSPASTATLSFTSPTLFLGTALVTVTVNDGNRYNGTVRRQFSVTVIPTVTKHVLTREGDPVEKTNLQPDVAASLTPLASADGEFDFQVTGLTGGTYVVQATTDLAHWTSIQTNTAPFTVQDRTAGAQQRFYRAYYQP